MKKRLYRTTSFVLAAALLSTLLTACSHSGTASSAASSAAQQAAWTAAQNTPFKPYPQTVTYTLGKMTGANRSNMPAGDTYENNAYTRYLKKLLNVQNKDTFETDENANYESEVELAVTNQDMPDVMVINSQDFLKKLVQNDLIENLSDVYRRCCSPRVQEMYESYDGLLDSVTFNGKLMALPDTTVDSGPNFLWLRRDWLKKLGLSEPRNLNDVEQILWAFTQQDPGANGFGKTLGLVCSSSLVGKTSSCYALDPVFEHFGAYPRKWVRGDDGQLQYGSVAPAAKQALALLQKWYRAGLIDHNFLLRTDEDAGDLVANGQAGAFFGWWWAPNDPLALSVQKDATADWEPYLLSADSSGTVRTSRPSASTRYIVVRKGCSHPEVVMKIMSALYDYARYQDHAPTTLERYFSDNVGPTATPLVLNCDYRSAVPRTTEHLLAAMQDTGAQASLNMVERAYYHSCKTYLLASQKGQAVQPTQWAAYASRITAVQQIRSHKVVYVDQDTGLSDSDVQTRLFKMEEETYLKIILGGQPLSSFDAFVQNWKQAGGSELTKRANHQE